MTKQPPKLAVLFLIWRIPAEHREFVIGDLNERFEERAGRGRVKAQVWYWRETLTAWMTRWNRPAYTSARGDTLMQTLLQDLQWAIKVVRAKPASSAAVVLTLALAIGANSTIFSWINRILLNPLPGVESSALVEYEQSSPLGAFSLSYPDYLDYRKDVTTLLLAGRENVAMTLSINDEVERVWGEIVTDNYFEVLKVVPNLGRAFGPGEAAVGASPVIVISHAFWMRKFAGDPTIVGREVQLNERPFTIVGVAPRDFAGSSVGLRFDVFVPMSMVETVMAGGNRLERRGSHWFKGIARLQPGETIVRAREEMEMVSRGLVELVPAYKDIKVNLRLVRDSDNGGLPFLRPVLMVMMGVVSLILLIACANIANLLLAAATTRRREIAIRLSMGATRSRLIRQLMTEGLLLASAGAAGGLLMTQMSAGLLNTFAPPSDLPISMNVSIDLRVLAFTAAITVTATLMFALIPALRLSSASSSEAMKDGSAGAGARNRLRNCLVVVQVALSLALIVAAGLCMQSLDRIRSFNPGFNKDGVLLASLDLFPAGYDAANGTRVLGNILDQLETLPGVSSFTLARHIPLGFTGLSYSTIEVAGYTPEPNESPFVAMTNVGPDYLGVMNIPLIAGRDISRSDLRGAPLVAVVSEALAKHYWRGQEAVGRQFRTMTNGPWITVVGVARDMKWREVKEGSRNFIYIPVLQAFHPSTVIHVRTTGDPALLSALVREAVRRVAPEVPVFAVRTLSGHVGASAFQQSMASSLLAAFGALALTLAALGVYGVLAFLVGQRTREIGIRVALGAKPRDVFRMVIGKGLMLTGTGIVIGITAAYGLASAMSGLLFGVSPSDPVTLAAGASLLLITAIAACLIPAYRAMRVDPTTALKCE